MKSQSGRYLVSFYEVGQVYGGPEEGGWWFNAGYPSEEFLHLAKVFKNRSAAERYWERLSKLDTGDHKPIVEINTIVPKPWPQQRPYYC